MRDRGRYAGELESTLPSKAANVFPANHFFHSRKRAETPRVPGGSMGRMTTTPVSLVRRAVSGEINVGSTERIASGVGGALLALYGFGRRDTPGYVMGLLGTILLQRGATGHCMMYQAANVNTAQPSEQHVRVVRSITINRRATELYAFWRDFENLPRFLEHLESVEVIDATRSRWRAKAPAGTSMEWVAVIIEDTPGERIAWETIDNALVPNRGIVVFEDLDGRGTHVKVDVEYDPPAGHLGQSIAKLFGRAPEQEIEESLRKLKQLLETGDVVRA